MLLSLHNSHRYTSIIIQRNFWWRSHHREKMTSTTSSSNPQRRSDGSFIFPDFPDFVPNRSPEEILRSGSFGGTYFRPIKSAVCPGVKFGDEVWKELPKEWISGLDPGTRLCSSTYRPAVNKYKVKSGASLEEWEQSGWIKPQDPYGWFQWYCRFFQGRRTEDDERQVSRWIACAGETSGRWRNRLCKIVFQQGKQFDDPTASPVIRQTLLHWGYELTKEHYVKWGQRQGAEVESDGTEEKRPKASSAGSKAKRKAKAGSDDEEDEDKTAKKRQKKTASKARSKRADSLPEGKPHEGDEQEEGVTRISATQVQAERKEVEDDDDIVDLARRNSGRKKSKRL